jgi:hypothetical protein
MARHCLLYVYAPFQVGTLSEETSRRSTILPRQAQGRCGLPIVYRDLKQGMSSLSLFRRLRVSLMNVGYNLGTIQ